MRKTFTSIIALISVGAATLAFAAGEKPRYYAREHLRGLPGSDGPVSGSTAPYDDTNPNPPPAKPPADEDDLDAQADWLAAWMKYVQGQALAFQQKTGREVESYDELQAAGYVPAPSWGKVAAHLNAGRGYHGIRDSFVTNGNAYRVYLGDVCYRDFANKVKARGIRCDNYGASGEWLFLPVHTVWNPKPAEQIAQNLSVLMRQVAAAAQAYNQGTGHRIAGVGAVQALVSKGYLAKYPNYGSGWEDYRQNGVTTNSLGQYDKYAVLVNMWSPTCSTPVVEAMKQVDPGIACDNYGASGAHFIIKMPHVGTDIDEY